MLHENIKRLRQANGLSQEELAARLHVVRQTISKWEKGLSVPDADLLIRLAEVFGVPVGDLLGERVEPPAAEGDVAAALAQLNLLMAERSRRSRRNTRILIGTVIALAVLLLLLMALSVSAFLRIAEPVTEVEQFLRMVRAIYPEGNLQQPYIFFRF